MPGIYPGTDDVYRECSDQRIYSVRFRTGCCRYAAYGSGCRLIGMTRQTVVLAFNFGDGLGNYIIPMSSALMANLMAAGVSYGTWMKFMKKVFASWVVLACIAMIVAQMIHYGPF